MRALLKRIVTASRTSDSTAVSTEPEPTPAHNKPTCGAPTATYGTPCRKAVMHEGARCPLHRKDGER